MKKFFKRFLRLDYINYIFDIFGNLIMLTLFVAFSFICLSALLIENGLIVGYDEMNDLIYNCRIFTIGGATNDLLTSLNLQQIYILCAFCWMIPYWIIDTLFNYPYKEADKHDFK